VSKLPENSVDVYLESRLHEWAEWLKSGNFLNIGYPRQSVSALIMEGKCISKKDSFRKTVEANESAEEIEKFVVEMAQYKPLVAKSLQMYYLEQLSFRQGAKKLSISYAQYSLYVQMAKSWLISRLVFCNGRN
jgi:hypothetical protein